MDIMEPCVIDDDFDFDEFLQGIDGQNRFGIWNGGHQPYRTAGRGGRDDPVDLDAVQGNANFIDIDETVEDPIERRESIEHRDGNTLREPTEVQEVTIRRERQPSLTVASTHLEIIDLVDSSSDEAQDTPMSSDLMEANTPNDTQSFHSCEPELIELETLHEKYLRSVREVFPRVSMDFLKEQYSLRMEMADIGDQQQIVANIIEAVITHCIDHDDYPKEEVKVKKVARKRKRDDGGESSDEEWTKLAKKSYLTKLEVQAASQVLQLEFENIPSSFIQQQLKSHDNVYLAYQAIEEANRTQSNSPNAPFKPLKKPRKSELKDIDGYAELQTELQAARRRRQKHELIRQKKAMEEAADAALEKKAFEEGDVLECGCCFGDTPSAKTTHCDAETPHFFCLDCAKGNVKATLEKQRHDFHCMDASGCTAEFRRSEQVKFIDEDTMETLDRVHAKAALREAEIDDLESCPFCDFQAICDPIEVDKEFRCENEYCLIVSCRLCKMTSHIPKTCAEHKKDLGLNERHLMEEKMTEALLRRCPKCKLPIIKDGGCNKVVCTQCGCYVCDVCGKDISREGYSHFNNSRTGCTQSDNTQQRVKQRIEKAEREAKEKIRAEHPDITDADLEIRFSAAVNKDAKPTQTQGLYGEAHRVHANHIALLRAENLRVLDARREELRRVTVERQNEVVAMRDQAFRRAELTERREDAWRRPAQAQLNRATGGDQARAPAATTAVGPPAHGLGNPAAYRNPAPPDRPLPANAYDLPYALFPRPQQQQIPPPTLAFNRHVHTHLHAPPYPDRYLQQPYAAFQIPWDLNYNPHPVAPHVNGAGLHPRVTKPANRPPAIPPPTAARGFGVAFQGGHQIIGNFANGANGANGVNGNATAYEGDLTTAPRSGVRNGVYDPVYQGWRG